MSVFNIEKFDYDSCQPLSPMTEKKCAQCGFYMRIPLPVSYISYKDQYYELLDKHRELINEYWKLQKGFE